MKTLTFLLATLLAIGLSWGQQTPAPVKADPEVLTIGNEKLTQSQFERIIATLPEQQRAAAQTPDGRRQMAMQLAELITLAQEARVRKLDQGPDVQTRLQLQTDQVLANAAYQALGQADDAAMHAYYDAHKSDLGEIHARHILIRFKGSRTPLRLNQKDLTEEEALAKVTEVRAKIVAGAKFEDVAKTESDDPGSGENGGVLDPFTKGSMVAAFEDAAFALPIGQMSEPVKSEFGYHLILVESHKTKSFEDASPEILREVGPEQAKKGLEALKKKTTVVFNETYFGK
jgi:peptidyl-prolyl cis-trans isomerase C